MVRAKLITRENLTKLTRQIKNLIDISTL